MLRWTKLIAPMAALTLLIGFHQATLRADDTAPAGKATVTVTVVDSAGKAVAGATVGIMPGKAKKHHKAAADNATTEQAAAGKPKPFVTGVTGADGTVALANVPDGTFTVRAHLKGTGTGTEMVTVADDKDQTVTVTLKAKGNK